MRYVFRKALPRPQQRERCRRNDTPPKWGQELHSGRTAGSTSILKEDTKGGEAMDKKMFMRVDEVAAVLDVSVSYAYNLIRELNRELKEKGCMVIAGRIDRQYFYERFYGGTQIMNETKEDQNNAGIQG